MGRLEHPVGNLIVCWKLIRFFELSPPKSSLKATPTFFPGQGSQHYIPESSCRAATTGDPGSLRIPVPALPKHVPISPMSEPLQLKG